MSHFWICCRFVLTVCIPEKPAESTVVFLLLLPPQGFAFTSRDKPGFRPEFLPLTYLAKILSDIEEQGSVCVYICVCVCILPLEDLDRMCVCVCVRARAKCSSLHHKGARKEACVWCYILFKTLYLPLTPLPVFQL